jgi:catalase
MALQFKLPGGQLHQMAMLNTPMFGAASPQTFLELMQALKPDPATGKPDPEKMKAFKETHPDNLAQTQYLASHNPPASYASSSYWGIHTFKFIDKKGKATPVRWQFVPQDGEIRLTDEELKSAGGNFLESALIGRTAQGAVRWDMMVSVGQPGDPEDNPTLSWPEERKRFKAGTLTIRSAMAQKGAACESINFDPLVMADGIAPSSDPVLLFRSPAYAVSFGKRAAGQ